MSTERELLTECLRALNCARRFNYGPRCEGWKDRFKKPDSYDLAARIEKHLHTTRQAENRTGCGAVGPAGYRCTSHENGHHVARGTEPGSFADSWPLASQPATSV